MKSSLFLLLLSFVGIFTSPLDNNKGILKAFGDGEPYSLNVTSSFRWYFLDTDPEDPGPIARYNFNEQRQFYFEIVLRNMNAFASLDVMDGFFVSSFNRHVTYSYGFGMLNSCLKGYRAASVGNTSVISSTLNFTGKHTYGFNFNGTYINIFYDGNIVGSATSGGSNTNNTTPLLAGSAFSNGYKAYWAAGDYYTLQIYNSSVKAEANLVGSFDFTNPNYAGSAVFVRNLVPGSTDRFNIPAQFQ